MRTIEQHILLVVKKVVDTKIKNEQDFYKSPFLFHQPKRPIIKKHTTV